MLNIQQVTEAINLYRQNKGFIKKLTRTDHPAIRATEIYLNSLQAHKQLSNQDLFIINRFFIIDHPVQLGKAAYEVWSTINYQNFIKQFSKLSVEPLDSKRNSEKMQEFFHVLSQCYLEDSFTNDCFLALGKLCAEGMLNQEYIDVMRQSAQASFLASCLIEMKRTDTLTTENQNFIISYSGPAMVRVTEILIVLEKKGLLTQKNFDLISAENNLSWLIALEEMPEELITPKTWQGLVNLSKISNEKEFKKDIQNYVKVLKGKLNDEPMQEDSLVNDEVKTQATKATTSQLRHSFFNSLASANSLALQDAETARKMDFESTLM